MGSKGVWKGKDASLQLKDGVAPPISKPRNALLPQRERFLKELNCQCNIKILHELSPEEAEESEWGFLICGILKKNKTEIRTTIDYHKLNHMIKRNPCFIEPMHNLTMSAG